MRTFQFDPAKVAFPSGPPPPVRQHSHRFSRRALLGGAAGVVGGVTASSLWATRAEASRRSNSAPKPTTNVININGLDFAVTFFGPGMDPSTITDFNGFVGVAQVQGAGVATYPDDSVEQLLYDTDMRFMSGVYVGQDGAVYKGTFGFV